MFVMSNVDRRRWSVRLHFMSGITLPALFTLLRRHGRCVDWRIYPHRVAFLLLMATFNSAVALLEHALFGRRIAAQRLHPAPLIILGHPRTGTTHLHNLLATDGRWAHATTFQAGFPSGFLLLRPLRRFLSPLLDETRPMDAMALHWDLPAEDEIATATLSGGVSPYTALVFPREEAAALRGLYSLEPGAATPAERRAWQEAFLFFLKKVTFAAGGTKPLLIKSPVHTARVRLLLEIFPNARFVFLHRHPLGVFASAANMAATYYPYTYLQRPTAAAVTEFILAQYEILVGGYLEQRAAIPDGRLAELGFEDLDRDPLAALERIYDRLSLGPFRGGAVAATAAGYLASLQGFRKNDLQPVAPELEAAVRARWGSSFKEWNYT